MSPASPSVTNIAASPPCTVSRPSCAWTKRLPFLLKAMQKFERVAAATCFRVAYQPVDARNCIGDTDDAKLLDLRPSPKRLIGNER